MRFISWRVAFLTGSFILSAEAAPPYRTPAPPVPSVAFTPAPTAGAPASAPAPVPVAPLPAAATPAPGARPPSGPVPPVIDLSVFDAAPLFPAPGPVPNPAGAPGSLPSLPAPAPTPAAKGATPTTTTSTVQIAVDPFKSPRVITEKLELSCRAIVTGTKPIKYTRLEARFDESVAMTRADLPKNWDESLERPPSEAQDAGAITYFTIEMPAIEDWMSAPFSHRCVLFFTGGRYPITIRASYDENENSPVQVVEKQIEVEFLPSPTALAFGGLAGSLLLVVFERLVRLYRSVLRTWPEPATCPTYFRYIWNRGGPWLMRESVSGIAQLLLGGVTAIVVMLIVGSGQAGELPVMIQIKGFAGAATLGLFTHLFAVWAYERLGDKGTDAAKSKEKDAVVPERDDGHGTGSGVLVAPNGRSSQPPPEVIGEARP